MQRTLVLTLAGLACLASLTPAEGRAMMIAPAPIPERVAQADCVVIGTVGKVEENNVSAVPFAGATNKVEFQIVALKVEDGLKGVKSGSEVRVGFIPPQAPPPVTPVGPGVAILRPARRPGLVLTSGQSGCFYLTRHPTESFYILPAYFSFEDKNTPTFDKDMELTQRCVKLLADPDAGLKSKDAEDRLLTAGMLITRYRSAPPGSMKTEEVDAEQSKLILQALSEADWTNRPVAVPGRQLMPQVLFARLGLTPQDGWTQPQDYQKFPEAARKWLKDNADTYRIKRFVADRTDKTDK